MNLIEIAPLCLVIVCNVGYHVFSNNVPNNTNPFFGLIVTYGVACLGSIVFYLITRNILSIGNKTGINIFNILLGLVVIGVEGGYMLMYQTGWEISKASLIANICLSVLLVIIGTLFFKEALTFKKLIGILICILGIIVIKI